MLRRLPIHPWLAAAYPVVALLAHNIDQIRLADGLRALLVALGGAALLWLACRLALRHTARAALLATLWLALFFSYGHLYGYLEQNPVFGIILGRHRLLLPLWLVLAAIGGWWAIKRARDLAGITGALNLMLIALLAFPIAQIASFEARALSAGAAPSRLPEALQTLRRSEGQPPPDIYLIILDAYARQDILAQTYAFDNTPFLNDLKDLGFYVAPCSQSNYAQTELSLATMLNLNYLETLGSFDPASQDRAPLRPPFRHSAVRQVLERLGYTIAAFDSGFYRTQLDDADVYLSAGSEGFGGVNGFEAMLIRTTAGLLFTDAATLLPRFLTSDVTALENARLRAGIRYEFAKLPKIPVEVNSPKFVFVHVMAPHDPYVFGANGDDANYPKPLSEAQEIAGYRNQVAFLNSQMIPVLRAILAQSATPPIIIVMGDHGPGWASQSGRMANLYAVHLPGEVEQRLYPTITPVNTFRVIFDAYFGGQLGFLDDASYFSRYDSPYDLRLIPNSGCEE